MDIKLTDGDLAVENNELVLIQGLEETAQNLFVNLKTYQGEWFLDQSIGMPWFQDILIKGQPINIISGLIKDAIVNTDGVTELNKFELDYDNETRTMTLDAKAKSANGDIVLQNVSLP